MWLKVSVAFAQPVDHLCFGREGLPAGIELVPAHLCVVEGVVRVHTLAIADVLGDFADAPDAARRDARPVFVAHVLEVLEEAVLFVPEGLVQRYKSCSTPARVTAKSEGQAI